MISYGSQAERAVMPLSIHSHQLGEGHQCGAAMPMCHHPSRLVYGGQKSATGTSPRHRLHQLGEGHKSVSEVPSCAHPPRLVYGSQSRYAAMPCNQLLPPVREGSNEPRSNAIRGSAPFPTSLRGPKILHRIVTPTPPPPVYGSLCYHAAMPIYGRSHLFTRGQLRFAEMPFIQRLSREGSSCPRRNAIHGSPFPTSLWKEHQ